MRSPVNMVSVRVRDDSVKYRRTRALRLHVLIKEGEGGGVTCRLVLWSEKGELKKVVTMLMTVSVT